MTDHHPATPDSAPPVRRPGGSRSIRILGIAALALVVTFAARELSWLLTPVLVSALIVTLVHPVYTGLRARRIPSSLALGALLLLTYGSIVAIVAVIVYALTRFVATLADHTDSIREALDRFSHLLDGIGIERAQAAQLLGDVDIATAARWLTSQIPSVLAMGAAVVVVGTLLVFLGVESTQLALRTRTLRAEHPLIFAELSATARRTRTFFRVTTVFALIVGVLDTIVLLVLDIPLAPLWGLLAAACNYVPYLGFWIGMAPPAVLALAVHGWDALLIVVVAYIALNFVITSLLPTKFISDAVGLSMTVEVVAILFWAWVAGPAGAILAIPLTLLVKAVLVDSNPRACWMGELLSSRKALSAETT